MVLTMKDRTQMREQVAEMTNMAAALAGRADAAGDTELRSKIFEVRERLRRLELVLAGREVTA
jgi:hypothetical protein